MIHAKSSATRLGLAQVALLLLLGACGITTGSPDASTVPASREPPPRSTAATGTKPATPAPAAATSKPVPSGPSSTGRALACPGTVQVVKTLGTPGTDQSTDWAGYTVTSTTKPFTCVEATWVQPAVTCSGTSLQAVAFWVGIGGVGQPGLVQTGTQAQCLNGSPQYSAWQQSLPGERFAVAIDLAVAPGDRIHAKVLQVGKASYKMTVDNLTTGTTFTAKSTNRTVHPTTAEWIVESPTVGCPSHCAIARLPKFGTATFTGVAATIAGVNVPLDAVGVMHTRTALASNSGAIRASVSSTDRDGRGFSVTRKRP